jgi:hypothetical protein
MSTRDQMDHAYEVGDHQRARELAHVLLHEAPDTDTRARAATVLIQTSTDWFLPLVGIVGLGLVTWLVYNYVL